MIAVMTGWSPAGFTQYGRRFVETFARHWPKEVRLRAYVEERGEGVDRATQLSLFLCDGAGPFIARHRDNPRHCGREPMPHWRPKYRAAGYNYRYDAVKFSRQCFIPQHAASMLADGDILVWLDADVVTFADVPQDLIASLLGDADLCFLGRERFCSEIGFWAMRVNGRTRAFVGMMADLFRTDAVFALGEWHSAFVFDHCRKAVPGLVARDLTPGGRGHVWLTSPLAPFTDHLKGNRKGLDRSPERGSK